MGAHIYANVQRKMWKDTYHTTTVIPLAKELEVVEVWGKLQELCFNQFFLLNELIYNSRKIVWIHFNLCENRCWDSAFSTPGHQWFTATWELGLWPALYRTEQFCILMRTAKAFLKCTQVTDSSSHRGSGPQNWKHVVLAFRLTLEVAHWVVGTTDRGEPMPTSRRHLFGSSPRCL